MIRGVGFVPIPFDLVMKIIRQNSRKEILAFIISICYNNNVRKPSTVWISERQALYDSRS